jgi:hypothetical protein
MQTEYWQGILVASFKVKVIMNVSGLPLCFWQSYANRWAPYASFCSVIDGIQNLPRELMNVRAAAAP